MLARVETYGAQCDLRQSDALIVSWAIWQEMAAPVRNAKQELCYETHRTRFAGSIDPMTPFDRSDSGAVCIASVPAFPQQIARPRRPLPLLSQTNHFISDFIPDAITK